MTDIKYDFFDQSFDVSTASVIDTAQTAASGGGNKPKYAYLNYQTDNLKPVINYKGLQFYPLHLAIAMTSSNTYAMVLETINKDNGTPGIRLFIKMNITHAIASTNQSLTALFTAINTNTTSGGPAVVKMNDLFKDPAVYNGQYNIYKSSTSDDLTLIIGTLTSPVSVKLFDVSAKITGNADLSLVFKTIATGVELSPITNIKLIATPLTQRQRCTRSTDNSSPTVPVVKPTDSNIQSNILSLVIIGLCVAAFFPSIYSIFVCLPGSNKTTLKPGLIHAIYLIGALSMIIPLFVRGFKDGDIASQVWGVGIILVVLIFGWQYYDLSRKQMLKCGTTNVPIDGSIFAHFEPFVEECKKNWIIIGSLIAALIISVAAISNFTNNDKAFGSVLFVQAVLVFIALFMLGR